MSLVGLVIRAPVMLLTGEISGEEARPVGIVGISQLGGQFIQESVEVSSPTPFLQFAAAISVALGMTNLLPIPALDGGRILFVLIEMIRGKPMDPAREGLIHLIGIVFMLGLMIVLIFADIINPVQLP
ncbi:MAG: site-2 protease family protein [Anaerolineae bacterium]|nr:site-2 protease family protein [Anaerolineae bacterium]